MAVLPVDRSEFSEWERIAIQQPTTSDWPSFHNGPRNTGYSPNATGPGSGATPTRQFQTYGGYEAPPIVVDGVVYAANRYGNLLAVDVAEGTKQWEFSTEEPILASPTFLSGTIYIANTNSRLYAVDATSGEEKWSFSTDGPDVSTATVADGSVFFGGYGKTVYSVDAEGGTENWRFDTEGIITTRSRISDAPAVANGMIYVGDQAGNLYALDTADGSEQWRVTKTGYFWAPAFVDGTVYAGSSGGGVYAFNADDGTEQWSFTVPQRATAPAVANGSVYVGRYEGMHKGEFDVRVYSLNAADGSKEWTFQTSGKVVHAPIVADGRVYVTVDEPPKVHAIDASSGQEVENYSADGNDGFGSPGKFTAPAVADGSVFVGTENGGIWGIGDGDGNGGGTTESPPTASFDYSPQDPEIGQTVTLDASGSTAPDGSIETFEWDVDGDEEFELNGPAPEITFDDPGDQVVTLRVTDSNELSDTVEKTIPVAKSPFQQIKESHLSTAREVDESAATDLSAVDFANTANENYTTAVERGNLDRTEATNALRRLNRGVEITATVNDYVGPDPELVEDQVNLTKKMAWPTIRTVLSLVTSMYTAATRVSQSGGSLLMAVVQGAKDRAISAGNQLAKRILGQAGDVAGTVEIEASQLAEEFVNEFYEKAAAVDDAIDTVTDSIAEAVSWRLRARLEDGFGMPVGALSATPVSTSPVSLQSGVLFFYELLSAERVVENGLQGSTQNALTESAQQIDGIEEQAEVSTSLIEDFQSWASQYSLAGGIIGLVTDPDLGSAVRAIVSIVLTIIGGIFDAFSTGAGIGGLIEINARHHIGLYEVVQGDSL